MKKVLSILYGIDDRYEMVKRTILVCEPYFDKIHIVNSGVIEFEDKLKSISNKIEIRTIENYHGDKEFCWRAHFYGLDQGDWVLWLDSDERPTQDLLDDIDNIIKECESSKKTNVRFLSCTHYLNDGKLKFDELDFKNFINQLSLSSAEHIDFFYYWRYNLNKIFLKLCIHNIETKSNYLI